MARRPDDPLDEVERVMALEEEEQRLNPDPLSRFTFPTLALLATVAVPGFLLWLLAT